MKRISLFISLIITAVIICGCKEEIKHDLNGIWTGSFRDNEIIVAFIDDLCFVTFVGAGTNKAEFSVNGDVVNIMINNAALPFTIRGNSLVVNVEEGMPFVLSKDTAKQTPQELKGIWNGSENTFMVFINDKVFISDNFTSDYATFSLINNNEVVFITEHFGHTYRLIINENILDDESFDGGSAGQESFIRID